MAELVKARWAAGFTAQLPDGTVLEPGSVADIPATQAHGDDHWEVVDSDVSKEELVKVAESLNVPVPKSASKAEIAKAIEDKE